MNPVDGVSPTRPPEDRLAAACRAFDGIFVRSLLKEMRAAGAAGSGTAMEITQDLYDNALGEEVSRGGGIGVGDMLYKQLSRPQVSGGAADN